MKNAIFRIFSVLLVFGSVANYTIFLGKCCFVRRANILLFFVKLVVALKDLRDVLYMKSVTLCISQLFSLLSFQAHSDLYTYFKAQKPVLKEKRRKEGPNLNSTCAFLCFTVITSAFSKTH